MKKPYIIIAPKVAPTSAGIKALYLLNDHLKEAGFKSRILVLEAYKQFSMLPEVADMNDSIVVYPDCYPGNPLGADNVVRYLLMYAGYFGLNTDTDFPESEYMYYYSPEFCIKDRNPDNVLSIPTVEERLFINHNSFRPYSCYLAIKYHDYFGYEVKDVPEDCIRVTNTIYLPQLFKTCHTMYTYDNSSINLEAALAGVNVVYRYNEKFEERIGFGPYWDWNNISKSYGLLKENYKTQLLQFIARTQLRFK